MPAASVFYYSPLTGVPYKTFGSPAPVQSGEVLWILRVVSHEAVPAEVLLPSHQVFPVDETPSSIPPDRFLRSSNHRSLSRTDPSVLFSRSVPASGSLPPQSGRCRRPLHLSVVTPPASSVPSPQVLPFGLRYETTPPVPADKTFLLPAVL